MLSNFILNDEEVCIFFFLKRIIGEWIFLIIIVKVVFDFEVI